MRPLVLTSRSLSLDTGGHVEAISLETEVEMKGTRTLGGQADRNDTLCFDSPACTGLLELLTSPLYATEARAFTEMAPGSNRNPLWEK
ncbi:unnamed protein product [Arctogadus glacialis]